MGLYFFPIIYRRGMTFIKNNMNALMIVALGILFFNACRTPLDIQVKEEHEIPEGQGEQKTPQFWTLEHYGTWDDH